MNTGVVGAGMMGSNIVKSAAKAGCVRIYDIDYRKACKCAADFRQSACRTIDGLLDCEVIFLAVPGDTVIPVLERYLEKTPDTVWVNVSTLVSGENLKNTFPENGNIVSIKIIGQADSMMGGMTPVIIVDPAYDGILNEEISGILWGIGEVVSDYENKYMDVNLYAAEAAMLTAKSLADKLHALDINEKVIHAAIKSVFTGTAAQFPYINPDYFHKLVFERHPDISFRRYF